MHHGSYIQVGFPTHAHKKNEFSSRFFCSGFWYLLFLRDSRFFHSQKRPLSTDDNSHISIELRACGERDKRTICKSSLCSGTQLNLQPRYRHNSIKALFFVQAPLTISSNEVSEPIETPYIVLYFQDKGTAHQFRKFARKLPKFREVHYKMLREVMRRHQSFRVELFVSFLFGLLLFSDKLSSLDGDNLIWI